MSWLALSFTKEKEWEVGGKGRLRGGTEWRERRWDKMWSSREIINYENNNIWQNDPDNNIENKVQARLKEGDLHTHNRK